MQVILISPMSILTGKYYDVFQGCKTAGCKLCAALRHNKRVLHEYAKGVHLLSKIRSEKFDII
jgi:hypothetical protein